jgi:hypothetical protein
MHHFDKSTYMNQDMIEYFGYSGQELKTQKIRVCELINANFLEYQNQHWWDFKNKDYIEYRKSLLANHSDNSTGNSEGTHDINALYPPPQRGRDKAKKLVNCPQIVQGNAHGMSNIGRKTHS